MLTQQQRFCVPLWIAVSKVSAERYCDAVQVVIDDAKVFDFLKASSGVFETILDAEDRMDGPTIEKVLADMEAAESAPIVQHLI